MKNSQMTLDKKKELFNYDKVFGNWAKDKTFRAYLNSKNFELLVKFLKKEYTSSSSNNIFPLQKDLFRLFRISDYKNIKVVIFDINPVTDNDGNGLAYGLKNESLYFSRDLSKIINKIEYDTDNLNINFDLTLSKWVEQGVLPINMTMSIKKGIVNSHMLMWSNFMSFLINFIIDNNPGVIFCLWGRIIERSFNTKVLPDKLKFYDVLKGEHPSLAVNELRDWKNDNFKQVNEILENRYGKEECIKW